MADEQQDVEITSENNTPSTIDEDDLKLSLSLRPLNSSSSSSSNHLKNFLEPSCTPAASNGQILTKRDTQALRRHEAKLKRDCKRKASSFSAKNDDVIEVNQQEDIPEQQRRKVLNLGFQGAAPPWFAWNAGGVWQYQGQNGKFHSHNERKDGAGVTTISSGSSSGISDNYHSISGPGGNSSDAGSHSSHPQSPLPPTNNPTTSTTAQPQPCSSQLDLQFNGFDPNHSKSQFSSYSNRSELITGLRQFSESPEGLTSLNSSCQQDEARPKKDKTLLDKDTNTTLGSTIPKEAKGEIGKPPKPVGLIGQQKLLFSQMPCVSTTGNGPNGKTITGFLYKYTKAEVSIICVCHGASFSPAGFVEHAGGVDVEFPLKSIRVVPFALG